MKAEEKVLQMLTEGRISAAEAARLLDALEETPEFSAAEAPEALSAGQAAALRQKFRLLGYLPLLPGLPLLLAGMAWARNSWLGGQSIRFALAWLPLAAGAWLTWLGLNHARQTWVFVRVQEKNNRHTLQFGIPLPLQLIRWGLRQYGKRASLPPEAESVLDALQADTRHAPLLVQVDDEDARVDVFIG